MVETQQQPRSQAPRAKLSIGMGSAEGIRALLDVARVKGEIEQFLPRGLPIDRFMTLVVMACKTTPALQQCNQLSFLRAVSAAAELGLEPNSALGHGWLIPYKQECTFIPGYKGLITVAHRTGSVKALWARIVYRGEVFEHHDGTDPKIIHRPTLDGPQEDADLIAAYAVAELHDGQRPIFEVMPLKKILAVRARSSGWRVKGAESTWGTDFQEMARKTAVRKLAKYLPIENPLWSRLLEVDNEDYQESEMSRAVRSRPVQMDEAIEADFEATTPTAPTPEEVRPTVPSEAPVANAANAPAPAPDAFERHTLWKEWCALRGKLKTADQLQSVKRACGVEAIEAHSPIEILRVAVDVARQEVAA